MKLKKIVALTLAASMVMGMTGCAKKEAPAGDTANVIKIRKYHYIRTDMSIKHICFLGKKTLDKPAPKCGEAP